MTERRFPAMGTTVAVWADDDRQFETVRAVFDEVEAVCSRFRPDSALSRFNQIGLGPIGDPMLREIVGEAATARQASDGSVDAAVGAAVNTWGYDRTFSDVEAVRSVPAPVPAPDWSFEGGQVVASQSVTLDLGGIAKGWAVDRAIEGSAALVVNAGGDLRSRHPGTTVHIDDSLTGSTAVVVELGVGSLATSSTARRAWTVAGRRVSHVIDPRTGAPIVSPIVSASAITDTAVEAETASKTVLVMGEAGLAWADRQKWIRGVIAVWNDGFVYGTVDVEVAA